MSTAEIETRFTVLYEEPFWIGVSERVENGKLTVAKHTFGAEPSMAEMACVLHQAKKDIWQALYQDHASFLRVHYLRRPVFHYHFDSQGGHIPRVVF